MSKPQSKSTKQWLARQSADPFVKQAKAAGWRARSVFKLAEIAEKYHLLRPHMQVVDLGAAPGGWSQYVVSQLGKKVNIIAVDLLPIAPLDGVDCIQGDFCEQNVYDTIMQRLNKKPVDLVMSDMAPNMSGIRAVDQPRSMYLAELTLDFAKTTLKIGGACLVKCFQGSDVDAFIQACRCRFKQVIVSKPAASRDKSREIYVLALGFGQKRQG